MKKTIDIFIKGFPAVKKRTRGDSNKCKKWHEDILRQTEEFSGSLKKDCKMKVVFFFDESQYPKDYMFGPDLDNHLKSLWDALNKTIFLKAPGKDSCVTNIQASKFKANNTKTGVKVKIWI